MMSCWKVSAVIAGVLVVCACSTGSRDVVTADEGPLPAVQEAPEPTTQPAAAEEGTAKELKNTLRWTTASEVENFGFDIYRGTSEDGPFERLTEDPIPGAGTVDEPQEYVWEDTTIEPGVDYYYYIESISFAGVRERFSPVIKSPAKH